AAARQPCWWWFMCRSSPMWKSFGATAGITKVWAWVWAVTGTATVWAWVWVRAARWAWAEWAWAWGISGGEPGCRVWIRGVLAAAILAVVTWMRDTCARVPDT